jgi:hypothetical protein
MRSVVRANHHRIEPPAPKDKASALLAENISKIRLIIPKRFSHLQAFVSWLAASNPNPFLPTCIPGLRKP